MSRNLQDDFRFGYIVLNVKVNQEKTTHEQYEAGWPWWHWHCSVEDNGWYRDMIGCVWQWLNIRFEHNDGLEDNELRSGSLSSSNFEPTTSCTWSWYGRRSVGHWDLVLAYRQGWLRTCWGCSAISFGLTYAVEGCRCEDGILDGQNFCHTFLYADSEISERRSLSQHPKNLTVDQNSLSCRWTKDSVLCSHWLLLLPNYAK